MVVAGGCGLNLLSSRSHCIHASVSASVWTSNNECGMHACIDPAHGALMSLDAWRTTAPLAVLAADSKQRIEQ
jgi:hypothetical protein